MGVPQEARENIAKLLGRGTGGQRYDAVGIGSGSQSFTDSNTSLGSTVDSASGVIAEANGATLTLVGTFTGNSAAVREASAFTDSGNILLARQLISTVNVQASDTLEITWDVEVQ